MCRAGHLHERLTLREKRATGLRQRLQDLASGLVRGGLETYDRGGAALATYSKEHLGRAVRSPGDLRHSAERNELATKYRIQADQLGPELFDEPIGGHLVVGREWAGR